VLTLVAATLVVVLGAIALVARLELPRGVDRFLAVAIAAPALVVLTLLVANFVLGGLTPDRALGAAVLIALLLAAMAGRERLARLVQAVRVPSRPHASPTPLVAVVAVLAAAAAVWRFYAALVLPPYAFDALTYHLTMVATWISGENLEPTTLSLCCGRYPAAGELLFTWPALFTGTDTGVDFVQLVFALIAAVATGAIAHALGAWASGAMVAACLFFLTPVVLAQTTTNYVDVVTTAGILVALYFTIHFLQAEPFGGPPGVPPRPALLVPAGIGAGLALGTKATGVLVVVVIGALLVARIVRVRGRLTTAIAAFLVPTLLVGSFWYFRNLVQTGNPMEPVEVSALGVVVFDGPVELDDLLTVPVGAEGHPWPVQVLLSWARDLAPWVSADEGYSYEQRLGGLGPLWTYLGAPLLLLLAARALAKRRWSSELDFLVVIALVFVLQPYQWWARFTLVLAAAGCVAIVLALERTGRRRGLALATASVLLAGVGAWYVNFRLNPAGNGHILTASELVALRDVPATRRTIGQLFFDEYAWVDRVPKTATIGVELGERVRFVYPLFGPRFEHEVVRLSGRNRAEFRRRLRDDGVDFALVGRGGRFDAWLEDVPVAHEDERTRAYRLNPGRLP
jgi:hypothetical protein